MDMVNRSGMETTKAFLSRQYDRYRPAFGRTRIDQPRRCIFIGTTNQDNYLRDETGSRRFWPILVSTIDIEALKRDRDQLWAEAVAMYSRGDRWWLDASVEITASDEQKKRNQDDPWTSFVLGYIALRKEITIREILVHGLCIPLKDAGRKDSNRVAGILKANGWGRVGRHSSGMYKAQVIYGPVE